MNGSGQASISTAALAAGTHSITASYSGDADYTASTSTALAQVVDAANSLVVTSDADTVAPGTLLYAVNQANSDAAKGLSDTITFDIGSDQITLLQGALELTAGSGTVTINGGGQVIINGDYATDGGYVMVDKGAHAVFTGLTIEDFELTAGINNDGTLTVNNSTIANNDAGGAYNAPMLGGGIYNAGTGTLILMDVTIAGNYVTNLENGSGGGSGGGVYNAGTMTATDTTFSGNMANGYGGAIYNDGTLTLTASTLSGNGANSGGGVYSPHSASTTLVNTIVAGNTLPTKYGGTQARTSTVVSSPAAPTTSSATAATPALGDRHFQRRQPQSGGQEPQHRDQSAAGPAGQLWRAHADHGPPGRQSRYRGRRRGRGPQHRPARRAAGQPARYRRVFHLQGYRA